MKNFLNITAIAEGITGLLLVFVPSIVVSFLLGVTLIDPAPTIISRLAGVALLTIAFACRLSAGTSHANIMVKVMVTYNVMATALLMFAGIIENISGPALWPAVLLHVGLVIWTIFLLRKAES